MSKQLVTVIGLVVSLGVIALGVFLVAMPLYFQAVSVVGRPQRSPRRTRSIRRRSTACASRRRTSIRSTRASPGSVRRSPPPASSTTSSRSSAVQPRHPGSPSPRSRPASRSCSRPAPVPPKVTLQPLRQHRLLSRRRPTPRPTRSMRRHRHAPSGNVSATGRQQVDFEIQATADDMAQATAFLDALRSGPRLLSSISAIATGAPAGTVDVQISALTYLDAEG